MQCSITTLRCNAEWLGHVITWLVPLTSNTPPIHNPQSNPHPKQYCPSNRNLSPTTSPSVLWIAVSQWRPVEGDWGETTPCLTDFLMPEAWLFVSHAGVEVQEGSIFRASPSTTVIFSIWPKPLWNDAWVPWHILGSWNCTKVYTVRYHYHTRLHYL